MKKIFIILLIICGIIQLAWGDDNKKNTQDTLRLFVLY
jgi:hypothetical protein